jgi:hypothetical protein
MLNLRKLNHVISQSGRHQNRYTQMLLSGTRKILDSYPNSNQSWLGRILKANVTKYVLGLLAFVGEVKTRFDDGSWTAEVEMWSCPGYCF